MGTDAAPERRLAASGHGRSWRGRRADDEWAESYDHDLVSWSYQAPRVVAKTVAAVNRTRARCSTWVAGPDWSARP